MHWLREFTKSLPIINAFLVVRVKIARQCDERNGLRLHHGIESTLVMTQAVRLINPSIEPVTSANKEARGRASPTYSPSFLASTLLYFLLNTSLPFDTQVPRVGSRNVARQLGDARPSSTTDAWQYQL